MSSDQWAGACVDGLDDAVTRALVRTRRFFTKAEVSPHLRTPQCSSGREDDAFYCDRPGVCVGCAHRPDERPTEHGGHRGRSDVWSGADVRVPGP